MYRIAGGAPLYITDWTPFGGPQPVTHVSDLGQFQSVPADGTFLVAAENGHAYHIAGGAPLYLSSWAPFGVQPYVKVNQATIDRLDHLRAVPADGTFLVALGDSGAAYHMAGGAPLRLTSWAPFGAQPYVGVNKTTIDTLDHMRAVPSDGTVLQGVPSGMFWVIQSGHRQAVAGPQPSAVKIDGATIQQIPSAAVGCPCSVWTSAPQPTSTAVGGPVELGLKIRSGVSGSITGIRFYKPVGETGTHMIHLWTGSGVLLGTAASSSETTSGWQQANFSAPVAIAANTTYVASYLSNGRFGYDVNAFALAGVDNGPLHALRSGVDGPNSVYGIGSAFPANTYQATNYWVDVVFTIS